MFQKILIANRGEIAVRIARTVQAMGIRAAAVYSDPDARAMHVRCADEAWSLGGASAGESYLCGERIIDIARACGADAIHPGYGFLSENAAFAEKCAEAGITFIGPPARVIAAMGDKVTARQLMTDAGVPVVAGATIAPDAGEQDIRALAAGIGYPVLVKAVAGGGGKGMRVVRDASELGALAGAARREAAGAFGDDRIFLEKYLDAPRHIEFQVLGDRSGRVVHCFERECSIQRRHQKIIEESPAPGLDDDLRGRMGQAAVQAARAIGYSNTGTVEFLVDGSGAFYFLEVNTRLQVEHPVTEAVTGLDLVRLGVQVAAGNLLPFVQSDLRTSGHAVECRVYAEDPAHNDLPSVGRIECYVPPDGPGVRVDSGVEQGDEVAVYYDPMIAKVITHDRTRDNALTRMIWALDRFAILGVTTNVSLLRRIVVDADFQSGRIDTGFLDRVDEPGGGEGPVPRQAWLAAAAALANGATDDTGRHPARCDVASRHSPWHTGGAWRAT